MTPDLKARFDKETRSHPVVIYMKGNTLFPRCGFSAAAVQILQAYGPVHGVDVLSEPDVRDGIKEYTRWPTIPQVFIHGKFVGGSDIIRELEFLRPLAHPDQSFAPTGSSGSRPAKAEPPIGPAPSVREHLADALRPQVAPHHAAAHPRSSRQPATPKGTEYEARPSPQHERTLH